MFDDDVSDEDISAEALAAMFRRSREKDRAALDDFVATERSMRRDDSEGAARDQAVVGMYAAQRQRQRSAPDQVARPAPRRVRRAPPRAQPRRSPPRLGRGDDAATVSVVPPKDEATKELEDRLERCRADLQRGRETQRRLERSLADAARRAADVEARQDAEDAALDAWAAQQRSAVAKERKGVARERRRPDDDAVNGDYSSRDAEIEALKATVARLQLQGDKRRQKFLQREHQLQTAYEQQKREVDDLTARVRDQEALALAPSKPAQKKRPAVREAQTPVADKDAEPPWRPVRGREGLRERRLGDGSREVAYRNGTTKRVDADGTCVVRFANGDVKTSEPSGATIYYYAAADTTHTTDPRRRVEVFEFPNGQVETHSADGAKDIRFPDGTTKTVRADGSTSTRFPDGVVVEGDA